MSKLIAFLFLLLISSASVGSRATLAAIVIDFEELPVAPTGFYNGDITAGSPFRDNYQIIGTADNFGSEETLQLWNSGGVAFNNNYTLNFQSWTGWSWSNVADATTAGFGNQYAAAPGGGSNGMGGTAVGGTYAISFGAGSYFNLQPGAELQSIDVTNGTYPALSMLNGDQFAKQFGGADGNDPDLFQVTLSGFDALGGTGNLLNSITVDLADYRFADNSQDFILNTWQTIDISGLTGARSIALSYTSTDNGMFGINTPQYLAVDNLTLSAVPEPSCSVVALFVFGAGLRRRKA